MQKGRDVMEIIDLREDINKILKKNFSGPECDAYIISNQTCTSLEVVYLFVAINRKYGISLNELCNLLDNYLTINKLCEYISENKDD